MKIENTIYIRDYGFVVAINGGGASVTMDTMKEATGYLDGLNLKYNVQDDRGRKFDR